MERAMEVEFTDHLSMDRWKSRRPGGNPGYVLLRGYCRADDQLCTPHS